MTTYKSKRTRPVASVRELIHFQLNTWTRGLSHTLASSRIKLSSEIFEVINKMLKSSDKIATAEATLSPEQFLDLIISIIEKTDYRIDIKTLENDKYEFLKDLVFSNELSYVEFDPVKRREIELDNKDTRLGIWHESVAYSFDHDYKVVINTGYADKPTILLNIVIGDKGE